MSNKEAQILNKPTKPTQLIIKNLPTPPPKCAQYALCFSSVAPNMKGFGEPHRNLHKVWLCVFSKVFELLQILLWRTLALSWKMPLLTRGWPQSPCLSHLILLWLEIPLFLMPALWCILLCYLVDSRICGM